MEGHPITRIGCDTFAIPPPDQDTRGQPASAAVGSGLLGVWPQGRHDPAECRPHRHGQRPAPLHLPSLRDAADDSAAPAEPVVSESRHTRLHHSRQPTKTSDSVKDASENVSSAPVVGSGSPVKTLGSFRLTSPAAHGMAPAISPDGKWVAYLSDAAAPPMCGCSLLVVANQLT